MTQYVRRDIWSLEEPTPWDPVTLGYARAVDVMRGRPADDPTSWDYQAAMHGTYARPPAGADWNQCQHASWFFTSWHRMYVYFFERIVRSVVTDTGGPQDWALPYWNYSTGGPQAALPPAFREATWTGPDGRGGPNPLYTDRRAPGANLGWRLPQRAVSFEDAYSYTNFSGAPLPGFGGGQADPTQFGQFTGALENRPHNVVHDLVGGPTSGACQGGLMSDPNCAAQDPVFWLHHANIDRLWTNWAALGGGRANPADRSWLDQEFTFYDENGKPVQMSASDILHTATQLGYRYDDQVAAVTSLRSQPLAAVGGAAAKAAPQPAPTMVAASESGVELGAGTAQVRVPMAAGAGAGLAVGEPQVTDGERRHVYLNVEGVQAEKHPGVVYEVYLNMPDGTDPVQADNFFVGHVTFFGAGKHADADGAHPATGGMTHTFDVTGLVAHLKAAGAWRAEAAQVSFQPLGLTPPPGAAAPAAAGPAPGHNARIARVSLSVH
ncbi:tyrosinase family protein [Pilimelia terevasa]|nr:tyrosinase family protein [Pilimelia terevasa]